MIDLILFNFFILKSLLFRGSINLFHSFDQRSYFIKVFNFHKSPMTMMIDKLASSAGFEPATLGLEGRCSIRLSYEDRKLFSTQTTNLKDSQCGMNSLSVLYTRKSGPICRCRIPKRQVTHKLLISLPQFGK